MLCRGVLHACWPALALLSDWSMLTAKRQQACLLAEQDSCWHSPVQCQRKQMDSACG